MSRKEKIQHLIYQMKVRFGWVQSDPPDQIGELKKDPQKPPEYLERFSLTPLEAPDQVLGREKDLENLQLAYKNWKQVHRSLLLVGEAGCGLSSFLCAATPLLEQSPQLLLDDYRIYERKDLLTHLCDGLDLTQATSIEQVEEQLLAGEERVVIFENVERLFLRTLSGFDLLEELRALVDRTSERVFWILTINPYPLYYLDRISGIRSFFDNNFRYQLQPLDVASIEATIENRNKGYELIFLKSGDIPASLERALSRSNREEKQELLRTHFFQELHAFAAGNISRALLFWITSIQGARGEKIYLKSFVQTSLKNINSSEHAARLGISQHGLFALEAIFQHSSLSAEDLDIVLRNSEERARLTITELLTNKWVYPRRPRKGKQEYQINLMYQLELKKLLVDRFNRNIETR